MRSSSRWIRPVSECAVAHTCAPAPTIGPHSEPCPSIGPPALHVAGAPPCPQTAHRAGGAEGVVHTCSRVHDPHIAGRPRERRISASHSARRGDLVAANAGRMSHLGTLYTGGAEAVEVRRPLRRATPRALPTVGGAAPVAHAPAPIASASVAGTSVSRMPVGRAPVGAAHRGYIVMSRAAVARQWRLDRPSQAASWKRITRSGAQAEAAPHSAGHVAWSGAGRRARSMSWMYGARGGVGGRMRSASWRRVARGGVGGRMRSASWMRGARGGVDSQTQTVSWRRGAWSGAGGRRWGGCRGIAGARGKIVAAEPWYMVREGVYIGVGGHRPVFGSRCGSPGVGWRSAKRRCE